MKQCLLHIGAQRDRDPDLGSTQSCSGGSSKANVVRSTFNVDYCSGKEEEKKGGAGRRHITVLNEVAQPRRPWKEVKTTEEEHTRQRAELDEKP